MIPGHVADQDPANKPYKTQKTYITGREAESPQINKADMAAPIAEMIMQAVTWSLSLREPMVTKPIVQVTLIIADMKFEVPAVSRTYVGR